MKARIKVNSNFLPKIAILHDFVLQKSNFKNLVSILMKKKNKTEIEDKTFFATYYDAKQVRISQENHLLLGFPLNY